MHPCVCIIFLLLLLSPETSTANQLVAVGGGGEPDNGAINKCFDKERYALLHFRDHLQDPNGFLSTWRDDEYDCCKWRGVTCNDLTGHVTELELSNYDFVGEISGSLVNLTYLNHLDLSYNSFHGTIPTSMGSLTELTYLALSDNSLHGTIPPEFGNLTNLQSLYLGSLGSCRVENIEWLSHLSHLEGLVMNGVSLAKANHWVDVILSLRNLSNLRLEGCELSQVMYPYSSSFLNSSSAINTLSLGNNSLASSMYRWLFPLTSNSLLDLDLSNNMLDSIPEYLGDLCNLTSLYLQNNSAVVKFPGFLKNLSGCTSDKLQELHASGSQFIGSLSDDIQYFSSLEALYLSHNHLNGTISEKLWDLPNLQTLDLSSDYLRGSISGNIGKSKTLIIDLSENMIEGVPSIDHVSNLSDVQYLFLRSCKLGPHFPKWIQMLKNLIHLDISNTSISDQIPLEFWDMWPSQIQYLNLSYNNISGKVPDLLSNFDRGSVIDLSHNSFSGPLSNVSSTLASLDLSKNKFNGGISFLCQIVNEFLEFINLSNNFLTGQLPDCLWHFKELKVLNLGYNNLSGRIPISVGSLIKLEALYLYKNEISGELPLSLKNCTSLNSLNLGANKFSGKLPTWIGKNLSRLYVLILRSNYFFGSIPLELCQLPNLQILDLSMNTLHGNIPSCMYNLTSMVQQGFSLPSNVHPFTSRWYHSGGAHPDVLNEEYDYVDNALIEWQGYEREFTRNLGFLKSIDLSSNNLSGQIPYELANLYELLALNLSKNSLLGQIPQNIGQMKQLLTLDLSRNYLSGGIPSSLSQMTLLNDLDVSFNNLSGRIPSSTQLQSFEPSRYDGNPRLCGPPVSKVCPGDKEPEVPTVIGESDSGGEDIDEFQRWFYIGGGTGFAIGFWTTGGTLLLSRRGRRALFHLLESFKDWVYVKVVVFVANLQRTEHI